MKLSSKKGKEVHKLGEPRKNKSKKVMLLSIVLVFSGAAITIAIYHSIILPNIRNAVRQQTIKEMTKSDSEYVQAWKLNKDIGKGKSIDIDKDLDPITVSSEGVPKDYIQDKQKIKKLVSRIDLKEKIILSEEMLVDMNQFITDSTKNQDYDYIKVHAFAKQGDYVDIHYKKVDGTDYIVSAKKKLLNLNGSVLAINLEDEDERALINGSTVEAAYSGGTLYTSIYPEPENQTAATVTYKVNDTIKKIIDKDPNALSNAKAKLKDSSSSTKSSTDKSVNNNSSNSTTSSKSEKTTEMKPPLVNYVAE